MLSGIKFIPRDQLNTLEDDDVKNTPKKDKRDERKKKVAKKKKSEEYSSDSDDRSESSDSSYENEKKEKGKIKDRAVDDSSESEEIGKSKRKRKKKSSKDFSDDDNRDLSQARKDLARKELGLEWMLGSGRKDANTDRNVSALKYDTQLEEPQTGEVRANPRELNPYYKGNGSGYPEETSPKLVGKPQLLSSSVVGDGGASWRLKALKRAREQAAREGKKLDEVVEERWGSLGHLAASVSSRRAAPTHAHLHAIKDRRKGNSEISDTNLVNESNDGTKRGRPPREYLRDVSSRNLEMKKPKQDSLHWKKNRTQTLSREDNSLISAAISGINKFSNDGSFLESISNLQNREKSPAKKEESNHGENDTGSSSKGKVKNVSSINTQGLSANQLAAKVLQLKMKGRHEEAEQLSMEAINNKLDAGNKTSQKTERNASSRYSEKQMSCETKRREDDADLHLARTIMKDKKYSISGSVDDEYDYDGKINVDPKAYIGLNHTMTGNLLCPSSRTSAQLIKKSVKINKASTIHQFIDSVNSLFPRISDTSGFLNHIGIRMDLHYLLDSAAIHASVDSAVALQLRLANAARCPISKGCRVCSRGLSPDDHGLQGRLPAKKAAAKRRKRATKSDSKCRDAS